MSKELLEATYVARDKLYASLGDLEDKVITHLVNPSFTGSPVWPDFRQAWRMIRKPASTIIVSDGLADPFSDSNEVNCGFELEVLVEVDEVLSTFDDVIKHWAYHLVYDISQQVAAAGDVRQLLDENRFLSFEIESIDAWKALENTHGRVGVMLGVTSPELPQKVTLPGGEIILLTAKLLLPSELESIVRNGSQAREQLNNLFAKSGLYHKSSLIRPAVI